MENRNSPEPIDEALSMLLETAQLTPKNAGVYGCSKRTDGSSHKGCFACVEGQTLATQTGDPLKGGFLGRVKYWYAICMLSSYNVCFPEIILFVLFSYDYILSSKLIS